MTHQSPSPLCEVDKSSLADLPGQRELGTGQEDQKLRLGGGGRVYELRSYIFILQIMAFKNIILLDCTVDRSI